MESGDADSPLVQIRGLEKSYGPNAVLRGVDLDVYANEVLTLFGPNGAGKTTLLRILATLTRPDAGPCASTAGTRREPVNSSGR